MMFYTRAFFRFRALRFTPPGRIDEDFYTDIRARLVKDPNLKFTSEFNYWQTYRNIFIVFLVFIISLLLLAASLFLFETEPDSLVIGFSSFFAIILFQPSVYFIILTIYYFIYRVNENRFHADFKKAIAGSADFVDFKSRFYTGKYAEPPVLKEYQFEGEIDPVKNFVVSEGLALHIAIYKYSRPPFKYIILSDSCDINQFIERLAGWTALNQDHPIRRVIKDQTEIPCEFGNSRLKSLMEIS